MIVDHSFERWMFVAEPAKLAVRLLCAKSLLDAVTEACPLYCGNSSLTSMSNFFNMSSRVSWMEHRFWISYKISAHIAVHNFELYLLFFHLLVNLRKSSSSWRVAHVYAVQIKHDRINNFFVLQQWVHLIEQGLKTILCRGHIKRSWNYLANGKSDAVCNLQCIIFIRATSDCDFGAVLRVKKHANVGENADDNSDSEV